MKGFIKITDVRENIHYLNVNHIINFGPVSANLAGNTIIKTTTEEIQTSTTSEEVVDMIDLSFL
ncbi:MAG: hypothetical protein H7Y10_12255 [Flavobacterium sp.]|nr:hypothetical protein [Flavobacterium sp.]